MFPSSEPPYLTVFERVCESARVSGVELASSWTGEKADGG